MSTVVLARPLERARVLGASYPKTLIDAYGERVVLEQPPQRIVSAMLATDEILLDLIPQDRIVALTSFAANTAMSNISEQAKGIPSIPGLKNEEVIKRRPDLVLVSRLSDGNVVTQLRQCGVPVVCFGRFDSLAEIRKNVLILGQIVGAEQRAQAIVREMDRVLNLVRNPCSTAKQHPRVLYYSLNWTAGRKTIFDELVQLSGGRNAAAEAGIVGHKNISEEMVIALNPEVIIMPFADIKVKDRSWQSIRAIKNNRVYILPTRHLNCISHHVAKAAVDVGHALHPDLVPAKLRSK